MANHPKRVLILGGGFGGLYTALHLEKKLRQNRDVEITLVNRENFFLFTPMLHEVAAGDLDLTPYRQPGARAAAPNPLLQWRHQVHRFAGTSGGRNTCR